MNRIILTALALACLSATVGLTEPVAIPYATMQMISDRDSGAVIAEKAAKVLPRPNQTDWMRLERTFFLHFGVNTFNEVEWGSGREEPSIFNPAALDANQWLDAITNFGGKMIVLVCKHHDGFCMWPTRYTPHSVMASSWRDGKGDLVREVADAACAHGIKLGVYLSPADLYQLRTTIRRTGPVTMAMAAAIFCRSSPRIRPASKVILQKGARRRRVLRITATWLMTTTDTF